ncbi:hypothetical protein FHX06_005864 [Rhizobium sp. BK512]|jgi:hypothetical protein|nr:hypothetical protein [Rhizobium sp. BK512]
MMLEDLYRLLKTSHVQAQGIVDTLTVPRCRPAKADAKCRIRALQHQSGDEEAAHWFAVGFSTGAGVAGCPLIIGRSS